MLQHSYFFGRSPVPSEAAGSEGVSRLPSEVLAFFFMSLRSLLLL